MKKKKCPKKAEETLSEKLFSLIKELLPLMILIAFAFLMMHEYRNNKKDFSETEKRLLPTGKESFDVDVTSTALYPNPSGDQ